MSTHTKILESKCTRCGTHLIEVSMKNPFIDDFETECPKCDPGYAREVLNRRATSAAKEEAGE